MGKGFAALPCAPSAGASPVGIVVAVIPDLHPVLHPSSIEGVRRVIPHEHSSRIRRLALLGLREITEDAFLDADDLFQRLDGGVIVVLRHSLIAVPDNPPQEFIGHFATAVGVEAVPVRMETEGTLSAVFRRQSNLFKCNIERSADCVITKRAVSALAVEQEVGWLLVRTLLDHLGEPVRGAGWERHDPGLAPLGTLESLTIVPPRMVDLQILVMDELDGQPEHFPQSQTATRCREIQRVMTHITPHRSDGILLKEFPNLLQSEDAPDLGRLLEMGYRGSRVLGEIAKPNSLFQHHLQHLEQMVDRGGG